MLYLMAVTKKRSAKWGVIRKMKTVRKNGFKIAVSGRARQVVLLCHGGWRTKDGTITIPRGMLVCFYAAHGTPTMGMSVYGSVCDLPNQSLKGHLKDVFVPTDEQAAQMARMNNTTAEKIRSDFLKSAFTTHDSFGGGNLMYDYALSREPSGNRLEKEKSVFTKHTRGEKTTDVDLMVMETTNTRHFSDAITIAHDLRYQTLHFGACRVPY